LTTVWCNGCFDLLHPGHMELFKVARSLGDRVIVGIDSDEKVRRDKGASRPINNLSFRKTMLESLRNVDLVIPFDTPEELDQLIELYTPDILLVGGDWRKGKVVGRQHAKSVRFFNRVGYYSSTQIIGKINEVCG
jgi:rfaE bifunctional protein nucleotidyltransferase chain/domain